MQRSWNIWRPVYCRRICERYSRGNLHSGLPRIFRPQLTITAKRHCAINCRYRARKCFRRQSELVNWLLTGSLHAGRRAGATISLRHCSNQRARYLRLPQGGLKRLPCQPALRIR